MTLDHADNLHKGFSQLWAREPGPRAEMERAFAEVDQALHDREIRKTGVGDNPLYMVIAIVLKAIQQNYRRFA